MVLYALVFSWWSLALHRNLDTGIFDLGIHSQAAWLFGQGLPDFLTTRGLASIGDHFTPILFLLSPLARPEWMLVVQTLVLASAAWPLFQLARQELQDERLALGLALAYLLQPGLWSANLFDFHASTLAMGTLPWALWGLHGRRAWLYWLALLLTLGEGEALGVSVTLIGVEAWRIGRRRTALATVLLGLGGLVLATSCMRAANHGQPSQYQSLFASLHLQPLDWLFYAVMLLLPLGFLPIFGWPRLLPIVPVVLANCLSWREGQRALDHHYLSSILPFLMWASVAGLRRFRPPAWSLVLLLVANLLMHRWQLIRALAPSPALVEIPAGASVSADNAPGAHLCLRQHLYLFPNPFQPLCWGNRPQAMVETAGLAGQPPLPGGLRRRLQECAVDYLVLSQAPDPWPLRAPDKAYWLREVERSRLYQNLGGGVWRRLKPGDLHGPGLEVAPRLSRDGQVLVYADSQGVKRQQQGHAVQLLGPGSSPEVSADGSQVLFLSSDRRLSSECCFLWKDGSLTRLGPDGPTGGVTAYWGGFAEDGKPLVLGFGALRQPPGQKGLWLGPVRAGWGTIVQDDGQLACRSLTGEQMPGCSPQPAGSHLVYCALRQGVYQLFDHDKQLTQGGQDSLEPSLSGDGEWLVYTQDGQVRLRHQGTTRTLGAGYNPCISGDGRWVAYADGRGIVWRRIR